jgi:hypothetical protein
MVDVTVSAAQAEAFYSEAVGGGRVWTVCDHGGFPQPAGDGGQRVQPFWSLRSRAEHIVGTAEAYQGMDVVRRRGLVDRQ